MNNAIFIFLSKMIPSLIYPTSMITILLLIALFLKSNKVRRRLVGIAVILLLICGNEFPGSFLIRQLETTYPPFDGTEKAPVIVVLGGCTESKSYPRESVEVNGAGDRILYGARLFKKGYGEKLLVGGSYIEWLDGQTIVDGSVSSPASEMAEIAVEIGVPKDKIILQNRSLNTYQEAVEDAAILSEMGVNKIILVSSATHMRRAVPLFEKQGLTIIPAPTDYSFSDKQWADFLETTPENFYKWIIPTSGNFRTLENAFKEYLGYFVYKLRGWL